MMLDEYNAKIILQMQTELTALKAKVAKMEVFLTDGQASWPMAPADQTHTSKTDDRTALQKIMDGMNSGHSNG